jgi:hypothetical protein
MSESGSGGDLRDGVVEVTLTINGHAYKLAVEFRMSLLDTPREELVLTCTKTGCDRGECGACTVHIAGRQANHDYRRNRAGRHAPSTPGGVHRARRFPMRFLYIRANYVRRCHDRRGESGLAQRRDGGRRDAVHPLGSVERADPRADERQSLPLCLLSQHCGCGRRRSGEELNHVPLCAFESR